MKNMYFILIAAMFALNIQAQRPTADQFSTSEGELTIQPVLHGTLMIQFNDNTIYVDPYGGAEAFKGLDKANLILITDIHGDHLNENTLNALEAEGTTIIAPQAVKDKMSAQYQKTTSVVNNGGKIEEKGLHIEAIPMYNLPEAPDAKHVKGRGNGYIVTFGDKRVYISGDTEDIPEMRGLKNIDIAFVCMNLPYTMDINQASSAVLEFEPSIVYPYHYRGRPDMSDTKEFKALVDRGSKNIEVRLRNWYPEYK